MLNKIRGWIGGQSEPWRPQPYRVTPTEVGADINYQCYCGCDAGFALDRSAADAAPEHCCCGNAILVGGDASTRLTATLGTPSEFRLEVDDVRMPWGETHEVALAIPRDADA